MNPAADGGPCGLAAGSQQSMLNGLRRDVSEALLNSRDRKSRLIAFDDHDI